MKRSLSAISVLIFLHASSEASKTCLALKNQLPGRGLAGYDCPETEREKREKNRRLLEHHIMAIDQDGYMLDPVGLKPRKDTAACDRLLATILDSAIQGVRSGRYQRIVFFIHGGLNTFTSSIGRAITLTDKMAEDTVDRAYPIFIIWKSGPLTTYWEHAWNIRQGREIKIPAAQMAALPFVVATDVLTGVARSPMVIFANGWTDIKTMNPTRFDKNANAIYEQLRKNSHGSAPMDVHKDSNRIGGWDRAWKFTNYVVTLPLRWLSAPVIDAFGTPDWKIMLRRTNTMFRTNDEFDITAIRKDSNDLKHHMNSRATGALSRGMQMLEWKTRGDSAVKMDLIGHSMGAIVANQILLGYDKLRFSNIVYMAPACKVRDFNEYVVPYLKAHAGNDSAGIPATRFYNLTLHPIAERREANVSIPGIQFDLFQRGSLLEWIDNFFSSPNNTDERTLGKYENIYQCIHMIPEEVRPQVTIKTFGVGRGVRGPQAHGSFSEYPFWRTAFWSNKPPADTTLIQAIPDTLRNHL